MHILQALSGFNELSVFGLDARYYCVKTKDQPNTIMDPKLLDILCCPITLKPLRMLNSSKLQELNQAIADQQLRARGGDLIQEPLADALVTNDGRLVYPVNDGVPVLLEEACIDLELQQD